MSDSQTALDFDGPVYDPALDRDRLTGQMQRIRQVLLAAAFLGDWLTLSEIHDRTSDPEASISAQIRHLRKPRFGSHRIDKRRRGKGSTGLWEYRMEEPSGASDPKTRSEPKVLRHPIERSDQ